MAITAPRIHLNGSTADSLREPLMTALHQTRAALSALAATAPNQRDYYTLPDAGAFTRAVEQHVARYRALDTVATELEALVIAIDEQVAR